MYCGLQEKLPAAKRDQSDSLFDVYANHSFAEFVLCSFSVRLSSEPTTATRFSIGGLYVCSGGMSF